MDSSLGATISPHEGSNCYRSRSGTHGGITDVTLASSIRTLVSLDDRAALVAWGEYRPSCPFDISNLLPNHTLVILVGFLNEQLNAASLQALSPRRANLKDSTAIARRFEIQEARDNTLWNGRIGAVPIFRPLY